MTSSHILLGGRMHCFVLLDFVGSGMVKIIWLFAGWLTVSKIIINNNSSVFKTMLHIAYVDINL